MATSATDCGLSNLTVTVAQHIRFSTHYVLLPIYFILGLSGNITLLAAFYKRSKTDGAYVYQILLTVSKTLEIFTFGINMFGINWWSGMYTDGAPWFQKWYWIQLLAIPGGTFIHIAFIISSLFFSVVMAADRVVALWKPYMYKNLNHKLYQTISTLICFIIPIIITVPLIWFYEIIPNGDIYLARVNWPFLTTPLANISSDIRVITRLMGIISLIILSIAMAILFRQRMTKVSELTNQAQKESARKSAGKTLYTLNVIQSVLMCVNQIPHSSLDAILHYSSTFQKCYASIAAPLCDACVFITDAIDLFVIMAVNKKIRGMVLDVFRCKSDDGSVSAPAAGQPSVRHR